MNVETIDKLELHRNLDLVKAAADLKALSDERFNDRLYRHELMTAVKTVFLSLEDDQVVDGHFKNRVQRAFDSLTELSVKCELDTSGLSRSIKIKYNGVNESISLCGYNDCYFTKAKFLKANQSIIDARREQLEEVKKRTARELKSKLNKVNKQLQALADSLSEFKTSFPELEYTLRAPHSMNHSGTNDNVYIASFFTR